MQEAVFVVIKVMIQLLYMKKLSLYLLLTIIAIPFFAHAANVTNPTENEQSVTHMTCVKSADKKRDLVMTPARKIYVEESSALTAHTKMRLESIKWHIDSIYNTESKKIYKEHSEEQLKIQNKISAVRITAQSTWKAESGLCDFAYKKDQSTETDKKKKSKNS